MALALYFICIYSGISTHHWISKGAILWGLAVLIKILCYGAIEALGNKLRLKASWMALIAGFWSALTELGIILGAAYQYPLDYPIYSLQVMIGLGAGAGIIEAILISGPYIFIILFSQTQEEEATPIKPFHWFFWASSIERIVAITGHISYRGLVCLGTLYFPLLLIGFAGFSAADGIPTYAEKQGWELTEPKPLLRYYLFIGMMSAISLMIFIIAYQLMTGTLMGL